MHYFRLCNQSNGTCGSNNFMAIVSIQNGDPITSIRHFAALAIYTKDSIGGLCADGCSWWCVYGVVCVCGNCGIREWIPEHLKCLLAPLPSRRDHRLLDTVQLKEEGRQFLQADVDQAIRPPVVCYFNVKRCLGKSRVIQKSGRKPCVREILQKLLKRLFRFLFWIFGFFQRFQFFRFQKLRKNLIFYEIILFVLEIFRFYPRTINTNKFCPCKLPHLCKRTRLYTDHFHSSLINTKILSVTFFLVSCKMPQFLLLFSPGLFHIWIFFLFL